MDDTPAARTPTDVLPDHEPPSEATPFGRASRDFLYGEVWSRPGLSRRERRWVTLTCVAAADSPQPIEDHVHAAIATGDIDRAALLEFVLHFAVYCGWPKASHLEGAIARQWDRVHRERGEQTPPWPQVDNKTLGSGVWDERLKRGAEEFTAVHLVPAPPANSPYRHAGIHGRALPGQPQAPVQRPDDPLLARPAQPEDRQRGRHTWHSSFRTAGLLDPFAVYAPSARSDYYQDGTDVQVGGGKPRRRVVGAGQALRRATEAGRTLASAVIIIAGMMGSSMVAPQGTSPRTAVTVST